MGGFGSNRKVIFTLGVILFLSFVLADCGKKTKGLLKKKTPKRRILRRKAILIWNPS